MATEQVLVNASPDDLAASALSALADGELTQQQFDRLLATSLDASEQFAAWQSYQLIGDVLRGEPVAARRAPQDFLAGVRAGLVHSPDDVAKRPSLGSPPVETVRHVRGEAANDAVLRWKRVAGVASVAAVMALSWALVRGVDAPGVVNAPQLAQLPAAGSTNDASRSLSAAREPKSGTFVVVNTDQGRLIRDPRLEQMLAEHRQYGAMSALQMPAGFLRNATYDDSPDQ